MFHTSSCPQISQARNLRALGDVSDFKGSSYGANRQMLGIWVLATQIFFYFHPDPWGNDPIWRSYFSNGLKPPTRNVYFLCKKTKRIPNDEDEVYPPGNYHIPYRSRHFWVDDFPNFPFLVGYVTSFPGGQAKKKKLLDQRFHVRFTVLNINTIKMSHSKRW